MTPFNRPLRVLHVRTVSGTGGGPDKTVLKSCEYLAKKGHVAEAFYMFNRRNHTGIIQQSAEELGVPLHAVLENGPLSWNAIRRLKDLLHRRRFDVIHTHEYKSNALARLFRLQYDYAIVATAHGYNGTTACELLYYGLERSLFRYVDAVIVPTRSMYRQLRCHVVDEKLKIIPNGIDTTQPVRTQRTGRNGRLHLLYLARLSAEKDAANLLQAVARMVHHGFDPELTVAGDGPERRRLEKLTSDLRLDDRVEMVGYASDVPELLARADVLVNPSRTECMPNNILEAMWAGVPVVATHVGGVAEMLCDGVDGLLCPPRNAEALADTVERLAGDQALARRLAENAHRRVAREFGLEQRMERVLALYGQVVHRTCS